MKNKFKAREALIDFRLPVVEVTKDNLNGVIEWMNYALGSCEARNGRIYTQLYSDVDGPTIYPGNRLIRIGSQVIVLSEVEYARMVPNRACLRLNMEKAEGEEPK